PAAAASVVEERAEDGRAVEARPAEPLDRAIERDERRRAVVADDRVVLDRDSHARPLVARRRPGAERALPRLPERREREIMARTQQPRPPFPEQHQDKPGEEAALTSRPRYQAPR